MAKWSDLPGDLLVPIAKRMVLIEDFLAFGRVCKSWNSAATKENYTGGFTHQTPLLMLINLLVGSTPRHALYNLKKRRDLDINIGSCLRYSSSLGWLIPQEDRNYLLHPFKDEKIVLPLFFNGSEITKFVLSSAPSLTSDYIVMVALATDCLREFAFWRPKDDAWTIISSPGSCWMPDEGRYDIAYYEGQFYIVENDGRVLVCDIEDLKKAKTRVVVSEMPILHEIAEKLYLVKSAGVLLLVISLWEPYRSTNWFRVFEVPLSTGNWSNSVEVKNLGNCALFLSENSSSFSIRVSDYSALKANCIYHAGRCLGVFSMEDGKMEQKYFHYYDYFDSKEPYAWIQQYGYSGVSMENELTFT
ncbi:F-box protein SKIP23-like [Rosa rugosa]|uniref:F-box protein SKIP23-like n=1 Tax=Rosa rugosa TaxID=74645 RepID=UPI002B4043A6|nr:F-box protein SKIP23-like [Rosa rugosa]